MNSQKLREVLSSRNFLASVITVVLLSLKGAFGIDLPIEDGDQLYGNIAEMVALVSAWIITPILTAIKRISEKNFDASFFINSNFITAVITVIGAVATVFISEELWGTISLILVNVLNVLFQVRKPSKSSLQAKQLAESLPATPAPEIQA